MRVVLTLAVCAALLAAAGADPRSAVTQGGADAAAQPGEIPAAYPPAGWIRAARRYVRDRAVSSFAVIDSHGRMHGYAPRRRYVTASLIKAMLLVAYLREIDRMPNAAERRVLEPMTIVSGNRLAGRVHGWVGDAALMRLARAAGMRDFSIAGSWGGALSSAADQASFFWRFDRLTPPPARAYVRELLSSIDVRQRWGFPRPALDAGFAAFFKLGWRGTATGRLVHAAGMFERDGERVSLAVLSDGNPSHDYAAATPRGVAERIFSGAAAPPGTAAASAMAAAFAARAPTALAASADRGVVPPRDRAGTPATRRAGLVDVHRFAPGILLDIVYATSDNITGGRLPGYCRPWALMLGPAARDLARVQRYLRRRGHGLLILDAYRPARATRALVRWAERSGRGDLVGTYIARRSRHNLGSAVDLTLVRLRDGRRLRLGRFDALGPGAHTLDATGRVLRNRLALKAAMERFGFANYWREWWHYEHRVSGTRYLDLPLGCG